MKKFKFALLTFMTALISVGFTACSDDDDLKNVSVTGVTITPTTLTLKAGTTGTLTATVVPENAAVTTVAWSSSDTNIATIENGICLLYTSVFLVIIQNSFFQCSLFRKGKSYVVEFKSANLLSSQHQSLRFFRIK